MLNQVMAWIQSKRIIISSLVIALACPSSANGYVSVNHHVINMAKLASNSFESWIFNRLFIFLSLLILFHICQWIFHLIRS